MPKDKRYALITAGRNEEKVIANFVESCKKQDYPMELIDIFVVAHNCSDKTAELAREAGANVVEYNNPDEARKGYALKYFFEYMKSQGVDIEKEYYAFILFDSDNVLAPDYVSKMKDCLQAENYDAAISYPNVKNMSEHWVAAMCGIHLHEVSVSNGRPRSVFNSSNWGRGCGMAFRSYIFHDGWKWIGLTEDADITMETAETHSMSMEFFAEPYMDLFFDEPDKYRYAHLASSICFLPYGVSVDEFQHWVYAHPEATPAERDEQWHRIEEKYTPWKVEAERNCEYLYTGHRWLTQIHIFELPFYYIDYTLAQVCAFQFFNKDRRSHDNAWKKYIKLCKLGGKFTFCELVKKVGLEVPFDEGVLAKTVKPLEKVLRDYHPENF